MARSDTRASRRARALVRRARREGFVRAYGDVSPGRPALRRHGAARRPRPGRAVVADRARRRLAGQGRAPARAARGRGRPVPRRARRHARRAAARRLPRCGSSARSRLRAAPARLSPRSRARCSGRCPSSATLRVGLLHLFIRHTSASLTLNENASPDVRERLRDLVQRRRARGRAVLDAHDRGRRRHARAHQGLAARPVAHAAGLRRPARARHLAGHLPLRAPRPRRRRARAR